MSEAAAVAGLGGLLSQGGNYGISKDLSDQAWKRQKTVLKKQIRWRVKDLRKAGLNPILAAGSSLGGGAPSVATGSSAGPDLGDAVRTAAQTYTANRSKKAEIAGLEAGAVNNSAQAGAADAAAAVSREAIITQQTQQDLNKATAGAAAANASVAMENAALLRTDLEKRKSSSEIYENPFTRKIMQAKEMLQGTPFITRPAPRRGTMSIDPNSQRGWTTKDQRKADTHNWKPRKR